MKWVWEVIVSDKLPSGRCGPPFLLTSFRVVAERIEDVARYVNEYEQRAEYDNGRVVSIVRHEEISRVV